MDSNRYTFQGEWLAEGQYITSHSLPGFRLFAPLAEKPNLLERVKEAFAVFFPLYFVADQHANGQQRAAMLELARQRAEKTSFKQVEPHTGDESVFEIIGEFEVA